MITMKKHIAPDYISKRVQELFSITHELEQYHPAKKFTLDGVLVGSIGEVLVAEHYGLTLLPNSHKTHDAITQDGKLVQIKTTQINKVSISSEPDFLIVIKLFPSGEWEEVYNGLGSLVWSNAGKIQKNGQRPISLSKLKELMNLVDRKEAVSRE